MDFIASLIGTVLAALSGLVGLFWLQDRWIRKNTDIVVNVRPFPEPQNEPVSPVPAPVEEIPAPLPQKPPATEYGPNADLVKRLIQVESGGDDSAIGDRNLTDKAYGCLQIRKPVCADVNRVFGLALSPTMMLGNRQLSIDTFYKYMAIYATTARLGRAATHEDRARIWNGGPSACFPGTKMYTATTAYWQKVRRGLID